jgi:hypothetical protein
LAALYFLFCCDECRQNINGNINYTWFAVPLEDWINTLLATSQSSGSAGKRTRKAPAVQINFIQVCRNYMRSPWKTLSDQVFLKHLYDAGTAFLTYPECDDLISFVAPSLSRIGDRQPAYSSVVVSIKSGLYFSPSDARDLCDKLKSKADGYKLKSALCVVCIFGQALESDDKAYTYNESMLKDLVEGRNIAIVLHLPQNDRFGLVDIFHQVNAATEQSELLSFPSFLRARGEKLMAKEDDALRLYDANHPRKAVRDYQDLLKDMESESDR